MTTALTLSLLHPLLTNARPLNRSVTTVREKIENGLIERFYFFIIFYKESVLFRKQVLLFNSHSFNSKSLLQPQKLQPYLPLD